MVGPKTGARMIGTPIMLMTPRQVARAGGLDEDHLADRQQHAAADALQDAEAISDSMFHAKPHSSGPDREQHERRSM